MSRKEYKRLVDYIREVNVRNREHRAIQVYAFEEGSEKDEASTIRGHDNNNAKKNIFIKLSTDETNLEYVLRRY